MIRDMSWPDVRRAKNAADWFSMCPNSALRTSITTRCPTSAIMYAEK